MTSRLGTKMGGEGEGKRAKEDEDILDIGRAVGEASRGGGADE